jgi:hypothetical protein
MYYLTFFFMVNTAHHWKVEITPRNCYVYYDLRVIKKLGNKNRYILNFSSFTYV